MGLASALAKGLNGYTEGLKYKDRLERQAKEDAWTEEQRNNQRAEWASADKQRAALSEAVRPAQVDAGQVVTDDAGSNAFTKDADAAAMMQDMAAAKNEGAGLSSATRVNQTAYTDPAKATQAASTYNSPIARTERMLAAVMPFDPAKGMSLANTGLQMQKAQTDAEQKLAERAKLIKAEGVSDVYKGMLAKDPQAIADGFNKTGELKIDGLPKLVQTRKVKTPYGEVDDDVWEATVTGADGKKRTIRQSTHQVGTQLYEVKDLLKDQSTAGEIGLRHSNNMKEIGARGVQERETVKTRAVVGADKTPIGREERMRYTTLFTDAGRRMAEANKALSTLLQDFSYANAKPGSPQAQEIEGLRETIKTYSEERRQYQSLLADGATSPGVNNAPAGNPNASERGLRDKVSGGMGAAPGAHDSEIAQAKSDLEKTTDPESRRMLQEHIAQMETQKSKYGLSSSVSNGPVRVASKAERDALPKGTQYRDPKGNVYVKN